MDPDLLFCCRVEAFEPPRATRLRWLYRLICFLAALFCRPTKPRVVLRQVTELRGRPISEFEKSLGHGEMIAVGLGMQVPPGMHLAGFAVPAVTESGITPEAVEFLKAVARHEPSRN